MAEFEAPDTRTLLIATGIAALIATVTLVWFILPAEYGIDPTGFGDAIGITDLGTPDGGSTIHSPEQQPFREDTVNITVPPGRGLEYKFILEQGSGMVYSWTATGDLFFDFHGEPTDGPAGYFESYEADTRARADGSFSAPFAGTHGWYWQNNSNASVMVTLHTAGHYAIQGLT